MALIAREGGDAQHLDTTREPVRTIAFGAGVVRPSIEERSHVAILDQSLEQVRARGQH